MRVRKTATYIPPNAEYWTEREVEQLLRISARTLRRWRKKYKLPYIRFNDFSVRYEAKKVREFIKSREVLQPEESEDTAKG